MKLKSRTLFLIVATLTAGSLNSQGYVFDITPASPSPFWNLAASSDTTFDGRSIYVRANSDFTIDQITWFGGVTANTYQAVIWQGLGESAGLGSQLALGSATLSANAGPQTIPINFTFISGLEYLINFRAADGTSGFDGSFSWDYRNWGNGIEEANLGLLTLMDGRSGFSPNSDNNSWVTHFSMNVAPVPEPSTLALAGLGGLGMFFALRKRK